MIQQGLLSSELILAGEHEADMLAHWYNDVEYVEPARLRLARRRADYESRRERLAPECGDDGGDHLAGGRRCAGTVWMRRTKPGTAWNRRSRTSLTADRPAVLLDNSTSLLVLGGGKSDRDLAALGGTATARRVGYSTSSRDTTTSSSDDRIPVLDPADLRRLRSGDGILIYRDLPARFSSSPASGRPAATGLDCARTGRRCATATGFSRRNGVGQMNTPLEWRVEEVLWLLDEQGAEGCMPPVTQRGGRDPGDWTC